MAASPPRTVFLKDYRPSAWQIEQVDLRFELGEEATLVTARLDCAAREPQHRLPLVLDGRELELLGLRLNGRPLRATEYQVDEDSLTIHQAPPRCEVAIDTLLRPQDNTSLEGLYRSSGNFCTQCEAEGFRKITYFLDRPDILARYRVTIVGDKDQCPVLLANGNLVESGDLPGQRHYAVWEDPFPKPSYLFALVAGGLAVVEDWFTTCSGRRILLQIYVQHHNIDKCAHAMLALQKAMRWDEEVFGLEYDLDRYMIVAVDDFNMGAMENKGLNVFNSKYVLAKPETATDDDFEAIQTVVAHEYFHNWTGNRVTCRDWFQLSLKEGLTVFRDQEFAADVGSRPVQRIRDVRALRSRQFPEDAGPMAHPVRPESYIEINNFYTVTVYEKGAELIRMLHSLLGVDAFRKGVRLYLARHDGEAATTDDFLRALAEASGEDLSQFKRWYRQAGTPEVRVNTAYDAQAAACTLTLEQSCAPTPGQDRKEPFHIPFALGLLDQSGRDLPLRLAGEEKAPGQATTRMLSLQEERESFRFVGVPEASTPSLLRSFSAPVKLRYDYSEEQLRFLFAHDSDPFNRWEAGQRLACRHLLKLIAEYRQGGRLELPPAFVEPYRALLAEEDQADRTFVSQLLSLPSEGEVAEEMAVIDVDAVHASREFMRQTLARELRSEWLAAYRQNSAAGPSQFGAAAAGRRRLKNLALAYLLTLQEEEVQKLAMAQFERADTMTDLLGALRPLAHTDNPHRQEVLAAFYRQWQHDPLVLDKWFALQASAPLSGTLEHVQGLLQHPAFNIRNPNRVRALIGAFAANAVCFHAADGSGYRLLADQILALDRINPQTAARLAHSLSRWRRYDSRRQQLMKAQLERIQEAPRLSRDVYEVTARSLAGSGS